MRTVYKRWFLIGTFCATCLVMHGMGSAAENKAAPAPVSPPQPAASAEKATIQFAETTYNFGDAFEGSEVAHDFVVKNVGGAVLQIEQVRPG